MVVTPSQNTLVADVKAMGVTLAKCAAFDLGVQWVGWALASAMKTEKFFDLAGKFTYFTRPDYAEGAEFCLSGAV